MLQQARERGLWNFSTACNFWGCTWLLKSWTQPSGRHIHPLFFLLGGERYTVMRKRLGSGHTAAGLPRGHLPKAPTLRHFTAHELV